MSLRSLNKIMLIGNLGEKPKFTSAQNGTPVCTFSMATNRSWLPKGTTKRREETQWHQVVTFNKLAEICHQILTKRTKVFVLGRIQTRRFVNSNGEKVRRKEIVASNVIACQNRKPLKKQIAS